MNFFELTKSVTKCLIECFFIWFTTRRRKLNNCQCDYHLPRVCLVLLEGLYFKKHFSISTPLHHRLCSIMCLGGRGCTNSTHDLLSRSTIAYRQIAPVKAMLCGYLKTCVHKYKKILIEEIQPDFVQAKLSWDEIFVQTKIIFQRIVQYLGTDSPLLCKAMLEFVFPLLQLSPIHRKSFIDAGFAQRK